MDDSSNHLSTNDLLGVEAMTPTNYPEVQEQLNRIFYQLGLSPPNYPVPALPTEVGYHPDGGRGSYVYICNRDYLQTFWCDGCWIEERWQDI